MKIIHAICIVLLAITSTFSSCGDQHEQKMETEVTTYTCPMHPQIMQDKPGTCPVCGMDLVLFDRTNQDEYLTLNAQQMLLANISTIQVGDTAASSMLRLNGRVIVDPSAATVVSARLAGRIERLYIKETGVKVNKGDLVYSIYSEELAALQQEYLVAAAQALAFKDDAQFAKIEKAARQKLILLGQTPQQLSALIQRKQVRPFSDYRAPSSGTVSEIIAKEGMYVEEGGAIIRLDNYNDVWIEADVYAGEKQFVTVNMMAQVVLPSGRTSEMKIDFASPELVSGSQILRIRGKVSDAGKDLLPGAQVSVLVPQKIASKTSLPASAVIRDGGGAHVWIEAAPGRFEPRQVSISSENAYTLQIGEGVEAGEKVVVSGAYLLHSEYILKKGKNPSSHQHQ